MPVAALLALLTLCVPAQADDYQALADGLAKAARRAGVKRVAVMSLAPIGGADANGASAVAERLVLKLAAQDGLQVVERALLDRVLTEQKLAQTGALDSRGAQGLKVLGVDAIVTGSLIKTSGRRAEVNVRLIGASDARVLGAASAEVRADWVEGGPGPAEETLPVPPPPALDGNFSAWWERSKPRDNPACVGWEGRVDDLQTYALPLKVRYWASALAEGVERGGLKRNPGSEIRSLRTRARFYAELREAAEAGAEPLSPEELSALARAESAVERLTDKCGG
ncbi:hypothetical protein EPO15_09215 [bacterium]|nr:MAG: hypothetical protein EPO15_09215 [bacterium]